MQEYREAAGVAEGMTGISTRFAFKVLSETFNYDNEEIAADPVHLMYVLEQAIKREQFPEEIEERYLDFIKSTWRRATPSSSAAKSRRPISNPTANTARTCSTATSPTPTRGSRSRTSRTPTPARCSTARFSTLELSKTEKPAGIANPKDFRNEVVKFALRARANNQGKNPSWTQLREDPRGDREAHVQPGRGAAADHQLRRQAGLQDREASTPISSPA